MVKKRLQQDFYGQRQITDIFTIDVNKMVISEKIPCSNGKNYRYIVGYQVDGFSHGVSQSDKKSAYPMSFNVSEQKEWVVQYRNIWNEVESQLFEKLATEPIKGKYVRGKLKTWKQSIKTNFHGQDVPYNMYCNATAVLNTDSV